jgi:hypothetical protein
VTFAPRVFGNILVAVTFWGRMGSASMPTWSIIFRWGKVAVLCVMVMNLHGIAVAGHESKSLSCQAITKAVHEPGVASHHNACCTGTQCCPVLPVLPCAETPVALVQLLTAFLYQPRPFLIVRGLDPPPKFQHPNTKHD